MKLTGFFGKKKKGAFSADYFINPEDYISQKDVPAGTRSLYSYIKIIFALLFPAGFALSFLPVYYAAAAAALSFMISGFFKNRFAEQLDTRLKVFVFTIIPPFCAAAGFAFAAVLAFRIAEIRGN
jgi:hypothetical protein